MTTFEGVERGLIGLLRLWKSVEKSKAAVMGVLLVGGHGRLCLCEITAGSNPEHKFLASPRRAKSTGSRPGLGRTKFQHW